LGKHWRGILLKDMDSASIEQCEQDASLKVLDSGELGDGRLVFQGNTRAVIESSENLHGINRNIRFVDEPLKVNHFLDAQSTGGARVVNDDVLVTVE